MSSYYWKKKQDALNRAKRNNPSMSADDALVNIIKDRERSQIMRGLPVKNPSWFQAPLFKDGYDVGDVTRTILGTGKDIADNLAAAHVDAAENIIDTTATTLAAPLFSETPKGVLFWNEKDRQTARDNISAFVAKDLLKPEETGKVISTFLSPISAASVALEGAADAVENIKNPGKEKFSLEAVMDNMDADDTSVLGEKADSLIQSGMHLAGSYAAQMGGVPTWLTMGINAYGSEVENAFKNDATYGEAVTSGAVNAVSEVLTEKLFGGIVSKTGFDDLFVKHTLGKIKPVVARSIAKFGIKGLGEAGEEALQEAVGNFTRWLTYEDDKSFKEAMASPEALQGYLDAAIGGALLGSVGQGVEIAQAKSKGVDYVTEMTDNEKKVFDKVFETEVAEAKKNGDNASKKQIYDRVMEQMQRGEISTDTIEEVLGGERYKNYKATVDSEDAKIKQLKDQLAELGKQPNSVENTKKYDALDSRIKEMQEKSERNKLHNELSNEVFGIVKDSRLAESYNQKAQRGQHFKADVSKYNDKQKKIVHAAMDSGVLNNTRRTHEFVDFIAKLSEKINVDFDFTSNEKLKDTIYSVEGATVNGYFDRAKGSIGININSAKALNSVVGHEITHVLEGTEFYDALKNTVVKYAQSKGDYDGRIENLKKLYKAEDIDSELVADLVGDYLFTDSDFVNKLSAEHRNIAQKIYDEVKYMCKVATAGSKEARELQRIKKAFEDAYRAAGKNGSKVNGAKHSLSDLTIDDIMRMSDEELDKAWKEAGYGSMLDLELEIDDSILLEDDSAIESISEETGIEPEVIKILYHRKGLGDSHVADNKKAVMTQDRINQRIAEHSSSQADYARRYITRISPKDFIDMTVYERNRSREMFDTRVRGDLDSRMGEWDYEQQLRDSEEPPMLSIDISTGQIIGHNGRHRVRALEMAGVESVEIEVEFHDEDGRMVKYDAKTIPDMAISSQFDTAIETHISNIIPFNKAHRSEIMSNYGEVAHENAGVKFSLSQAESIANEQDLVYNGKRGGEYVRTDEIRNLQAESQRMSYEDTQLYWSGIKQIDDGLRGRLSRSVKQILLESGNNGRGNDSRLLSFSAKGNQFNIHKSVDAELFYNVFEFSRKHLRNGELVDLHEVETTEDHGIGYKYCDNYLSEDGLSGFSITPDGDLISVFNASGKSGFLRAIAPYIKEHAKTLDCYISSRQNLQSMYESIFGFKTASIMDHNMLFDHDDIAANHNNPKVAFMINTENDVETRLFTKDQYDESVAYRNSYLNQAASNEAASFMPGNAEASNIAPVKYSLSDAESDKAHADALKRGDMDTAQRMVNDAADKNGFGVRGNHGTTNLFYVFDVSKSNIENDWGRGIYATTSEEDAQVNYASDDGADLTNRIERLAEMMENWEEYEDMDYDQRVEAARNQLSQGENRVLRVAFRMENPVIVERGSGGTFFTFEDGYNAETDEYSEPSGTLIELVERMQNIIYEDYEWASYDADKLVNIYEEAMGWGGLSAIQLQEAVDDLLVDVSDEDGNMAGKEILRSALEQMGYDGIIDKSVPYKFGELSGRRYGGMSGVTEGTTHYIAFNPKQVKLTDPATYDDAGNLIPLSKRFNPNNEDMRYSLSKEGAPTKTYGNYNVTGEDVAFAPVAKQKPIAPIAVPKTETTTAPIAQKSVTKEADRIVEKTDGAIPKDQAEKIAKIRKADPKAREGSWWTKTRKRINDAITLVGDKGWAVENLAKKTGNPKLEAKYDFMKNRSSGVAQEYIHDHLLPVVDKIEEFKKRSNVQPVLEVNGETVNTYEEQFDYYMKHLLNTDRMSLDTEADKFRRETIRRWFEGYTENQIKNIANEEITPETTPTRIKQILYAKEYEALGGERGKNKPVFSDVISAEDSRHQADLYEKAYPEFKELAQEVSNYLAELRQFAVNQGLVNQSVADRWQKMYPHYIPISRTDKQSASVSVPLDEKRTGVNNPFKRAESSNQDFEPLIDTLAKNTIQIFRAAHRNSFGVELKNTLDKLAQQNAESSMDAETLETVRSGNLPAGTRVKAADRDNIGTIVSYNATTGKYDVHFENKNGATATVKLDAAIITPLDSVKANAEDLDVGAEDVLEATEENDGALLTPAQNGQPPKFTVFVDGKRVTFDITDELYQSMKPTEGILADTYFTSKIVQGYKSILTEYDPFFALFRNPAKDAKDVLFNSRHAFATYTTAPKAFSEITTKGKWFDEYRRNGGKTTSYYYDPKKNRIAPTPSKFKQVVGFPVNAYKQVSENFEMLWRLSEYIASREAGASVEESLLDAARVTTNFGAGGDLTKWAGRNFTQFLNPSVQGVMQNIRNVREAGAKDAAIKKSALLAAKVIGVGLGGMVFNWLLWNDDDEYEELSDYVKQNYYLVWKFDDGKFLRIPKGRMEAVIQNGFEQMGNLITGNDDVDVESFVRLVANNIAPNNPIEDGFWAPISQAITGKTWYGGDLVPARLKDLPAEEQFDESTDEVSKWLGKTFNMSPYKINYVMKQYGGGAADLFLPMITNEAEGSYFFAPLQDQFVSDSVMKNQNVSDFYDTKDELTTNAKSSKATDKDILMSKYINSVGDEMSELSKQQREIQNSDLPDDEKYNQVREIQKQINKKAKESLAAYQDVQIDGNYATVGDNHYRLDDGTWTKISDKQYERQQEVTKNLGISPSEYWSKTDISFMPMSDGEYEYANDYPGNYAIAKAVGGYEVYTGYSKALSGIKDDKDKNGKDRKAKVFQYINGLDISRGEKLILFKKEYPGDDTYNREIVSYIKNRSDISAADKNAILKELGFMK